MLTGVGVRQQTEQIQKNLGDGQRRGPIGLQYVQGDKAARVDVGMVDVRCELDLRRLFGLDRNRGSEKR